jgi:cobalt-zinc-cadmium efflux system outer membrane protein
MKSLNYLIALLVWVSLSPCGRAFAEDALQATIANQSPAPSLTLQRAYELALQNNYDIKAAKAQLGEANADIAISKLRLNPSFVTDLGFIAEKTYRVGGIMQAFEPFGKRGLRIQVAKDQYALAEYQVAQNTHQVLSQVHQAYTAWIAALAKAQFQRQNAAALKTILQVAQQRFQGKEVEALDMNQANMLYLQAQSQILESENHLKETEIILATLLNTNHFKQPTISKFDKIEHLDMPSLLALTNQAFANRNDLKVNQAALQTEEDRTRLFQRSRIPNLILTMGYDMVTPDNKRFIGGSFNMAQFEIPLFNHQQGNIAKSQATHTRLLAERASLKQQIQKELQVSYQKVIYNEEKWHRFQTLLLPLANTVDAQAVDSYQRGKTAINDAIGQHQNAYNVRQEALETFISYQNSIDNLESSLSKGLATGGVSHDAGGPSSAPDSTGDGSSPDS